MQKLQDVIDTVFGDIAQKPGSHLPSDVAIERAGRPGARIQDLRLPT